uniref:Uncharacterized protein n=1 Tax=Panagrolaimus sp. PS1159 TaxID=55785 RepID=A0AC35GIS8_9BILA
MFYQLSLITLIFLFFNNQLYVSGTISDAFYNFCVQRYGAPTAELLARKELGVGGSIGGGLDGNVKRKPVIVVHGITNSAGTFAPTFTFFLNNGYNPNEVYGTTYGDAGQTNVLFVTMSCHYVKTIRILIQAVADYTHSQVNIIGVSMGSPIARKAILGGICVDTGEQVGPPMTGLIDTFVGVAGANFGSFLCVLPFGSCNANNGMSCGSRFLADVNAAARYEGSKIFTIYSQNDDKVGYVACGRKASEITGQNQAFEQAGMNHDQVIFNTIQLQYNLVTHGHA